MSFIQYYFGKWAKLTKGRPEDMECAKLCAAIRQAILNDQFIGMFLHIPNEELTDVKPQTALIKKVTGKIHGAADYIFIGPHHAFFIEMKAGKGKQSENQKMFQSWCAASGIDYHLCYSAEDAIAILERNKIFLTP
jgi:hypothetical protein